MIIEKRMSAKSWKQKVGSSERDLTGGYVNKKTGKHTRDVPSPYGKFTKPKSKKEAKKDLQSAQRDKKRFFKR